MSTVQAAGIPTHHPRVYNIHSRNVTRYPANSIVVVGGCPVCRAVPGICRDFLAVRLARNRPSSGRRLCEEVPRTTPDEAAPVPMGGLSVVGTLGQLEAGALNGWMSVELSRHFIRKARVKVGVLEDSFTFLGIFLAIVLFPFGFICCFALRKRRCPNCGANFT
ncbi:hypothetical protein CB1_000138009 [Camelus ferus]|nr:hypothetical protein CB1_000138009 [Camelus ferus]